MDGLKIKAMEKNHVKSDDREFTIKLDGKQLNILLLTLEYAKCALEEEINKPGKHAYRKLLLDDIKAVKVLLMEIGGQVK